MGRASSDEGTQPVTQKQSTKDHTMVSPTITTEPKLATVANSEDLTTDELELRAQGHTTEMPRHFSALSTLSLAFTITNSWIAYSAVFSIPLITGGGPCVIFSLVVGFVVCSVITLGLAELASAFPTSGGQYQYAFPEDELMPRLTWLLASLLWSRLHVTEPQSRTQSAG